MVAHNGSFIVFGGSGDKRRMSKIAKFDFKTWSLLGELKSPREGHGVIYNGHSFLIIGGKGRDFTTSFKQ